MRFLSDDDFKFVIHSTPLFALDLIIKNDQDCVLVGLRNNMPAKGYWFVPGGRVTKDEPLKEAFSRILFNETHLGLGDVGHIQMKGLYEHIYQDNVYDDQFVGHTHYIVGAFQMILGNTSHSLLLDNQHSGFTFMPINDLLRTHNVHEFTKYYFQENPSNQLFS